MRLPTIEVVENIESPHKAGIYPPMTEPISRQIVMINFDDIY